MTKIARYTWKKNQHSPVKLRALMLLTIIYSYDYVWLRAGILAELISLTYLRFFFNFSISYEFFCHKKCLIFFHVKLPLPFTILDCLLIKLNYSNYSESNTVLYFGLHAYTNFKTNSLEWIKGEWFQNLLPWMLPWTIYFQQRRFFSNLVVYNLNSLKMVFTLICVTKKSNCGQFIRYFWRN